MLGVTDEEWDTARFGPSPSGTKVSVQGGLLALAVLLLVWLWNVLRIDPFWAGAADALPDTVWAMLLLPALAVILVAEILLLRPSVAQAVLPDSWLADEDPLYKIGCSGCGTVFERRHSDVDEPDEQKFTCPNCGRMGALPSLRKTRADVLDLWCQECGTHFQAYHEGSECPACHAPQAGQ